MANSEGWDYAPDLGKKATEDVDDVVEREDDEQPEFGFEMDEADEDEESTEEADSDEEEDAEPVEKPADKTPDNAATDADKLADAVLKHVGGKTLVRIKGTEKPLEQFSKQEIVNWIQKSARADQTFQEAAASRRQVELERQRLEEDRERLLRDATPARGTAGPGMPKDGNIPDFLKPGPYDTEETVALKQYTGELQQRLDRLEGNFSQSKQQEKLRDIQREVDDLYKEYPMASRDEVLAVKLGHPEASTEELMRLAHTYYSSKEHIDSAFKSNPTYKREYDEAVIRQYLSKKQSAKKIAGQPIAAGSSSKKVAERGKIPIHTFEDATKASRAYLREAKRIAEED